MHWLAGWAMVRALPVARSKPHTATGLVIMDRVEVDSGPASKAQCNDSVG